MVDTREHAYCSYVVDTHCIGDVRKVRTEMVVNATLRRPGRPGHSAGLASVVGAAQNNVKITPIVGGGGNGEKTVRTAVASRLTGKGK